jgi:VanZ family protein
MSGHRSAAWPLSWVAAGLLAYATLHPLTGWQWPGLATISWGLPRQSHELMSDVTANLLGYLPLGLVLCLAWLRSGQRDFSAAWRTVFAASLLSYGLEQLQHALPGRVPSVTDWALNTVGAAWGVLGALTLNALGLVAFWRRLRERWFFPQAGHGLALLCLWPLGLLFPPPLPLGQGQIWPELRVLLVELTQGTPWQAVFLPEDPLSLWVTLPVAWGGSAWAHELEALTVGLGLLAPLCVAGAMTAHQRLRIGLMAMVVLAGVAFTALSSALNFGPQHAFSWVTLPAAGGMLLGAFAAVFLVNLGRGSCAFLGLGVLACLLILVHQVPSDPYHAQALQAWERGKFIRFHGLSRWFGLLWPFVALLWLMLRLLPGDALESAPSGGGN